MTVWEKRYCERCGFETNLCHVLSAEQETLFWHCGRCGRQKSWQGEVAIYDLRLVLSAPQVPDDDLAAIRRWLDHVTGREGGDMKEIGTA